MLTPPESHILLFCLTKRDSSGLCTSPLSYHIPMDRYTSFYTVPSLTHYPCVGTFHGHRICYQWEMGITERISKFSKGSSALLSEKLPFSDKDCPLIYPNDVSVFLLDSTLSTRSFSVLCFWPSRNGHLDLLFWFFRVFLNFLHCHSMPKHVKILGN